MTSNQVRTMRLTLLVAVTLLVVLSRCHGAMFHSENAGDTLWDIEDFDDSEYDLDDEDDSDINDIIHEGLYAHRHVHPDDYETTVPKRVSLDGEFVSLKLEHHHEESPMRRRKREANYNDVPTLHYNLTVGGRNVSLDLRPSHSFINPHLVVERHWSNLVTREKPIESASLCHYTGYVRGHENSKVAISACHGLAGMLRTDHGEFWLEPSKSHTYKDGAEHPHVLYKRSAAINRAQPRRPRRRHNGRGRGNRRGRRSRKANCGTKQPPRNKEYYIRYANELNMTDPQRSAKQRNSLNFRNKEIYVGVDSERSRGKIAIEAATNGAKKRQARSVSKERHVEVLLVADNSMIEFHDRGKVETYLLTIMNMVSSLYLDPTIGNFINVVVVKIILLEDEVTRPPLNVTVNADQTLSNFCRWQRELNRDTDDSQPNHHDAAILITRTDICAKHNTPCSTLGVAHVAGMCLPERSCSVNEDNGISLAHTITHELGHNFGMYHDTQKIGCERKNGSTLYVMTPIFDADTVDVAWSNCSRRDVTNFLDSGLGECLNDQPAQLDYIYPEWPPGVLYNATEQCRLQFGTTGSVCSDVNDVCKRLWCEVNGTCMTILKPQAPGTTCGVNMWCQNNKCVPETDKPMPIDGGWGWWSEWSSCSRTCGAGISMQTRMCNNPLPRYNGRFCTGERTKYKICNTNPCPSSRPSFREVQCSQHDNTTHRWKPYYDQDEPCMLFCSSSDDIVIPFGGFAIDGTPCGQGKRNMCISGICKIVGCDWIVESNATEDACGICKGNGSQCKTVQGIFSKGITKETGYSEVAVIPAGSRNIKVEEVSNSRNYIGIGRVKSPQIFTSRSRQNSSAYFAGGPILLERDRDFEKIKIPGPITEDIQVYQMLYTGRYRNPGVTYQYTIDKHPKYNWTLSRWSRCSRTCGMGVMKKRVLCVQYFNRTTKVMNRGLCERNPNLVKPKEIVRRCNVNRNCTVWWVGKWSICPFSRRTRNPCHILCRRVLCVDKARNMTMPNRFCDSRSKPSTQRRQQTMRGMDTCRPERNRRWWTTRN